MLVETVLPPYDYRAQEYVCLANGSNNIPVVGHLQVIRTCTGVFLCPTTAARTVIAFTLNKEHFFLWTCAEI